MFVWNNYNSDDTVSSYRFECSRVGDVISYLVLFFYIFPAKYYQLFSASVTSQESQYLQVRVHIVNSRSSWSPTMTSKRTGLVVNNPTLHLCP